MFDFNSKGSSAITGVAPLSPTQLDYLMLHLIRCSQVFTTALNSLKPQYFDINIEPQWRLMWEAVLKINNDLGKLPAIDEGLGLLICNEVEALVSAAPDIVTPDQRSDLFNLVTWCTAPETANDINIPSGLNYLRQFLIERSAFLELKRQLDSLGADIPADLPNMLQMVADRVRRLETINTDPVESAAPDLTVTPTPTNLFSTGVGFLDKLMNGGQASAEIYGILGPTGVGKTLMAVQLCTHSAVNSQAAALADPALLEHWYYFTYEAGGIEVRNRMLTCLSQIPIDRVSRFRMDQFSLVPTDYEKIKFSEMIKAGSFISERTRYANACDKLGKNCWIVDMSGGNPKDPKRGEGYVDEVRAILQAEVDKGRKIGGYVIDYVGQAAKRHIMASGSKHRLDQLRHFVSMFPIGCLNQISQPMKCPGWLVHQMNTEANRRGAGAIPHHAYASEAGNFAENLWFAFCLGTKDIKHNACLLACTKSRRTEPREPVPLIIDGAYGTMYDSEGSLKLDHGLHQIVTTNSYSLVHGTEQLKKPKVAKKLYSNTLDPEI